MWFCCFKFSASSSSTTPENKIIKPHEKTDIEKTNNYIFHQKKIFFDKLQQGGFHENIDAIFYQKKEFQTYFRNEHTLLENEWKSRILFESTPRGNIVMFYNPYKQGFSYFCDSSYVPYTLLNAVAMKYVLVYRCSHFFKDERVYAEMLKMLQIQKESLIYSPLIQIQKDQEAEMDKKNENAYIDRDVFIHSNKKNMKKPAFTKQIILNSFIYLGKIREFCPMQFVEKKIIRKVKPITFLEYKNSLLATQQADQESFLTTPLVDEFETLPI